MNVGSTFTGVGGLDLGFERAGMSIVWQCEQDEKCRRVLARHWPGVPIYDDIRNIGAPIQPASIADQTRGVRGGLQGGHDSRRPDEERTAEGSPVDLLCGGFPCQDLSVAGKRRGLDGERSGLFYEFARVADDLVRDGGWIVIENVPGLLSSNGGRDFAIVLASLAEIGFYDLAWRVLDSRYFGVPQRRRRVFIVARRARGDRARQVLLEPESGGGDFAPSKEAGARVAATLSHGASSPGVSAPGRRKEDDVNIVGTIGPANGGPDFAHAAANQLVSGNQFVSALGTNQRGVPNAEQAAGNHLIAAPTLTAANNPSRSPQSTEVTAQVETVQAAGAGVRRLTPTECERLQGFPDGWTQLPEQIDGTANPKPDSHRYAQMGNAVTVNVAQWIGERIMEASA